MNFLKHNLSKPTQEEIKILNSPKPLNIINQVAKIFLHRKHPVQMISNIQRTDTTILYKLFQSIENREHSSAHFEKSVRPYYPNQDNLPTCLDAKVKGMKGTAASRLLNLGQREHNDSSNQFREQGGEVRLIDMFRAVDSKVPIWFTRNWSLNGGFYW